MALLFRLGLVFLACFSVSSYLLIPKSDIKEEIVTLKKRVSILFPKSAEDLHTKLGDLRQSLSLSIEKIQKIPESSKNFANTIEPLIQIGNELIENLSSLSSLPHFIDDSAMVEAFYGEVQSLQKLFSEKSYSLFTSILSVLKEEKLPSLDGYERYYLSELIGKLCSDNVPLPAAQKNELIKIQAKLLQESVEPFVFKSGNIAAITTLPKQLKVFTLNTCFMPGGLSLLYGGVKSWQGRIDEVIEKIKGLNSDVICLQEVHDEKAASYLYDKLKEDYAYFYMNIGPKILGFSVEDIGLNSGLFVASKYIIKNPYFQAFATPGKQEKVNKGFFYFSIAVENQEIAHIATCHLEPFYAANAPMIREREIFEMLEYIKERPKDEAISILCGDFNIPWGKYEPGQYLMEEYFYDPFNDERKEVGVDSRTCTDFFNKTIALPTSEQYSIHEGSSEILDYVLQLKKAESKVFNMKTERIAFFDVTHPDKALSDHNGLLTTIELELQR